MESNRARDRENVTKKILKNSGSASARADTKATHQWLHPLPPARPPACPPTTPSNLPPAMGKYPGGYQHQSNPQFRPEAQSRASWGRNHGSSSSVAQPIQAGFNIRNRRHPTLAAATGSTDQSQRSGSIALTNHNNNIQINGINGRATTTTATTATATKKNG